MRDPFNRDVSCREHPGAEILPIRRDQLEDADGRTVYASDGGPGGGVEQVVYDTELLDDEESDDVNPDADPDDDDQRGGRRGHDRRTGAG